MLCSDIIFDDSIACILDDGSFFQASPLCATAACVDGVVMVSFHTTHCESYESFLLNHDERSIENTDY